MFIHSNIYNNYMYVYVNKQESIGREKLTKNTDRKGKETVSLMLEKSKKTFGKQA